MKPEDVYKCLSEGDRVRILNLLAEGPLCGCFLQEILGICQVKVSKQLAYLKKLGAVDSSREANWVVYMLAKPQDPILAENLRMLRAPKADNPELAADLEKRRETMSNVARRDKPTPQPILKQCCVKLWPCKKTNKKNKD